MPDNDWKNQYWESARSLVDKACEALDVSLDRPFLRRAGDRSMSARLRTLAMAISVERGDTRFVLDSSAPPLGRLWWHIGRGDPPESTPLFRRRTENGEPMMLHHDLRVYRKILRNRIVYPRLPRVVFACTAFGYREHRRVLDQKDSEGGDGLSHDDRIHYLEDMTLAAHAFAEEIRNGRWKKLLILVDDFTAFRQDVGMAFGEVEQRMLYEYRYVNPSDVSKGFLNTLTNAPEDDEHRAHVRSVHKLFWDECRRQLRHRGVHIALHNPETLHEELYDKGHILEQLNLDAVRRLSEVLNVVRAEIDPQYVVPAPSQLIRVTEHAFWVGGASIRLRPQLQKMVRKLARALYACRQKRVSDEEALVPLKEIADVECMDVPHSKLKYVLNARVAIEEAIAAAGTELIDIVAMTNRRSQGIRMEIKARDWRLSVDDRPPL